MRVLTCRPMRHLIRRPCLVTAILASALMLPGCGTYMVARTVTGAGSAVVGGTVGAVKLTGRAAGAVVTAGMGDGDAEE
ncbi:hypothetical protein [Hoeflea sp.]|uniref:hypothetical protein n=1 Tax=Hoeflea sp. TaxID=1940281 RepID=UPI003BAE9E93